MEKKIYMMTKKSPSVSHPVNQDRYLYSKYQFMKDGLIEVFIVADGMGGRQDGEIAAANAVTGFSESLYRQMVETYLNSSMERFSMTYAAGDMEKIIRRAFDDANMYVCMKANPLIETGTTLSVICIINHQYAVAANIGDSPIYGYRSEDREFSLLSEIQTQAEREVSEGRYLRYSPEYYKKSYMLCECMGDHRSLNPGSVYCKIIGQLNPGDAFLMGSDGAFGRICEEEIQELIESTLTVSESGEGLIAELFQLSDQGEYTDDQTAIFFRV